LSGLTTDAKEEITEINLKELVKRRVEVFQTLAENKRLKLNCRCENLTIKADKEDIIRIIDEFNLKCR